MDAESLQYPVIAFSGPYFEVRRSTAELTTDYLGAIRSGHYDGMTIVDRSGSAFRVTQVRIPEIGRARRLLDKVKGQRVMVTLELAEADEEKWDIERVRKAVRREFNAWDGWQSRDDYDDVMRGVAAAKTPAELIDLLERAGRGAV